MSGAKRVRFEESLVSPAKVQKTAEALALEMEETVISVIDALCIPDDAEESALIKELMEILFKMISVVMQILEEHEYKKMPYTESFVFMHKIHSHVCIKLTKHGLLLEYKDALEDNNAILKIDIISNVETNEIIIISTNQNSSPLSIAIKQCLIDNFGDAA
jgi:hypothetical protein